MASFYWNIARLSRTTAEAFCGATNTCIVSKEHQFIFQLIKHIANYLAILGSNKMHRSHLHDPGNTYERHINMKHFGNEMLLKSDFEVGFDIIQHPNVFKTASGWIDIICNIPSFQPVSLQGFKTDFKLTLSHNIPQCTWKTFMIHQTFARWALYILFKFVKSFIRHLGLAFGNVWWFSWTLIPSLSTCVFVVYSGG